MGVEETEGFYPVFPHSSLWASALWEEQSGQTFGLNSQECVIWEVTWFSQTEIEGLRTDGIWLSVMMGRQLLSWALCFCTYAEYTQYRNIEREAVWEAATDLFRHWSRHLKILSLLLKPSQMWLRTLEGYLFSDSALGSKYSKFTLQICNYI